MLHAESLGALDAELRFHRANLAWDFLVQNVIHHVSVASGINENKLYILFNSIINSLFSGTALLFLLLVI